MGQRTTYVFRDGKIVDKAQAAPRSRVAPAFPCPAIQSDIQPYQSPVSGEVIGSRSSRRDDLKRHNCIDARELGKN